MTLRQGILSILTVVVLLFLAGPALISSIQEQQITDRLELHQTDLLLQASELKLAGDDGQFGQQFGPLQMALVGKKPGETALKAYQDTRKTAQKNLEALQTKAKELEESLASSSDNLDAKTDSSLLLSSELTPQELQIKSIRTKLFDQERLINQLKINIGILHAYQGDLESARTSWSSLSESFIDNRTLGSLLVQLWSNPPEVSAEMEPQIQRQLTGWFRDRALTRLYDLQQDADALATLQKEEQAIAQQTVKKLALLSVGPVLGCIVGIGLIVFLVVQRVINGQDAMLAEGNAQTWETPWNWEITWQVVVVGFFIVGQVIVPLFFEAFKPTIAQLGAMAGLGGGRITAISTLTIYSLMSIATLAVLYVSIKKYQPFEKNWFRINLQEKWWLWGFSGYMVAIPLVIGVSVVNQAFWQGRGGSNPLLQTVLEEGDPFALGIFFFTAAIAAPIFEEILFRGFILPSMTRYMSTWGAIALSSFIFAAAHLSVSEILPLMILGMVLGFVYTRTKNLLAPMMVHSLWNSATMLGLFVLGSNAT
ncbi:MAG: type II CAAX endopeptidase family protein [Cyanobacteria bacterium P01_F01_bin.150]